MFSAALCGGRSSHNQGTGGISAQFHQEADVVHPQHRSTEPGSGQSTWAFLSPVTRGGDMHSDTSVQVRAWVTGSMGT